MARFQTVTRIDGATSLASPAWLAGADWNKLAAPPKVAETDFGLACLPVFAIRRQLESGILVSVLEDQMRDCGAFHILWPASRHSSPKLAAFVGFMAETLLSYPQPMPCRDAQPGSAAC
jgi:DNA-binding transcriptional LysR family regulator